MSESDSEEDNRRVIDYGAALQDVETKKGEECKVTVPKGARELRTALALGSQAEWIEWLQSKLVAPHWKFLWDGAVRRNRTGERGVGLSIVQRRLESGEAGGQRKFSQDDPDTEEWDDIDFYARFLYKVKNVNWADRNGVFYNRNFSDNRMDILVWSLKEALRQIHTPSQIKGRNGGQAVFGLTRDDDDIGEGDERKKTGEKRKQRANEKEGPAKQPRKRSGRLAKRKDAEAGEKADQEPEGQEEQEEQGDQEDQEDPDTPQNIRVTDNIEDDEADEVVDAAWIEETLKPKDKLALTRQSDTFRPDEPYWQYVRLLEAMQRVRRLPDNQDEIVDLSRAAAAQVVMEDDDTTLGNVQQVIPTIATAQEEATEGSPDQPVAQPVAQLAGQLRVRGNLPRFDADVKHNVFDPEMYEGAQDFVNGLGHALDTSGHSNIMTPTKEGLERYQQQREWMNNLAYQRDNVRESCKNLHIRSLKYPRLTSMVRSVTLKFWQPPAIWRLAEISRCGFLKGACLGDSMGIGKTWEAVVFLLFQWEEFHRMAAERRDNKQSPPNGKPFLVVVPPNLLSQWAREIANITDTFHVYTYYGDNRKRSDNSSYAIEERLTKGHGLFDGRIRQAKAVILTSYQTLATRHGPTAVKMWAQKEGVALQPGNPDMPDEFPYSLNGLFSTAIFDEAHNLRNADSSMSVTARWLEADFNLLLSGTIFYTGTTDMRGYAPLLFKNQSWSKTTMGSHGLLGPAALFNVGDGHPLEWMLCTRDAIEYAIDENRSHQESGGFLRKILGFVFVRRTLSSKLPFHTGPQIGNNIPPSRTKVLRLELQEHENEPYQAFQMKNRRHLFIRDKENPTRFKWNHRKLRRLVLASSWLGFVFLEASLKADNIVLALRCIEENKLLEMWRRALQHGDVVQEDSAEALYRRTIENTCSRYTENLEFLLRGSPKLRSMLPILMDQVLLYHEKATIWTMYPAEQVYIAAALKEAGIEYGVLHGKLDAEQRSRLIDKFTTQPNKCMVLVCSYSVDSSGLNLQARCRNVHLFTPPTSQSIVEQAIGRVQRIGQNRVVLVYDYRVQATFNMYLINRNRNKAIPGIVTELSPDMALAVDAGQDSGDLRKWVLREGKLTDLQSEEDIQQGDDTDADRIMEALVNSMGAGMGA